MNENEKKQSIRENAEWAFKLISRTLCVLAAAAKTPDCGGEVAVIDVESHQRAVQELGLAGESLLKIIELSDNETETEV